MRSPFKGTLVSFRHWQSSRGPCRLLWRSETGLPSQSGDAFSQHEERLRIHSDGSQWGETGCGGQKSLFKLLGPFSFHYIPIVKEWDTKGPASLKSKSTVTPIFPWTHGIEPSFPGPLLLHIVQSSFCALKSILITLLILSLLYILLTRPSTYLQVLGCEPFSLYFFLFVNYFLKN